MPRPRDGRHRGAVASCGTTKGTIMYHATTRTAALGLLSITLTLGAAASVGYALPDPGEPGAPTALEVARAADERATAAIETEAANPAYLPLTRIGDQLVRGDNLTGTGGRASSWVPESTE